jgi:hypothetical protein
MVELRSTLTCSHFGHRSTEVMPIEACRFFYECEGCGALLRPTEGGCCVFCAYDDVPCLPIQKARARSGRTGT